MNTAIESIVQKISTHFGAEDPIENEAFKTQIRDILTVELANVPTPAPTPAMATPVQQVFVPSAQVKRRNGYNLFASELRQKLEQEMGGNTEAAKKKFNDLGGVKKYCAEEWHKLTEEQQKAYNDKAMQALKYCADELSTILNNIN